MITDFRENNKWLSNFTPVEVELDGNIYPSVEHAYASAKSDDVTWKSICSDPNNTTGYIKRKGRKVNLVSNWETIKVETMYGLIKQKFNKEPFRSKLIETGIQYIQEGNYWNDTFWGVNLKTGEGQNILGKMIMTLRDELNNSNINK